ncbi:MAG TPA: DUF5985 family protein [Candidatus Binatia bacterium]|jgi:uncharacterized membrane protein HdeD (DUF308 family)|nr:DUF5985 family protein [Candidatus Binatia bacterium]
MDFFLLGAIAMASLTVGLFFLRFWKDTGDRLFLFFAMSFLLEGLNRAALGLSRNPNEDQPFFYFVRFLSYVLILIAIVNKNRKKTRPSTPSQTTNIL